jgi:hypothetical protein
VRGLQTRAYKKILRGEYTDLPETEDEVRAIKLIKLIETSLIQTISAFFIISTMHCFGRSVIYILIAAISPNTLPNYPQAGHDDIFPL